MCVDRGSLYTIFWVWSHLDHDGFGSALFSDQQHGLPLFGNGLQQEVRPHVVHVRDQDGAVVRDLVFGVDVVRDLERTAGLIRQV